jgi:hypothetical protein
MLIDVKNNDTLGRRGFIQNQASVRIKNLCPVRISVL